MRKAPARSTSVRLGFHRKRKISNVEMALDHHRKKNIMGGVMDKETKDAFSALNAALMNLMPKRRERRGVR